MFKTDSAWPGRTRRNALIQEAVEGFKHESGGFLGGDVWVAGRVVGMLEGGFVLQDMSGRADIFYTGIISAGDIVEAKVSAEKRTGEGGVVFNVIVAEEVAVLAKCNDEYFIRKTDPNWKRGVIDLKLKETLKIRSRIIRKTQDFFWEKGFTEVDTPSMVRLPGMEPYISPFKSTLKTQAYEGRPAEEVDTYLITSPEYAMKKLLVGGWEKIFQITKSFRNGETAGNLHNPEFTLIEWYRAYDDYRAIMKDTEELVSHLAKEVCGGDEIVFGDYRIDMKAPFERKRVAELFDEYAGIGEVALTDRGLLFEAVVKKGYKSGADTPYEDLFYLVFMNEIEPKLGILKPVFVCDYPVQMGALAKKSAGDPRFVERFELYIGGVELCNAFTELNDPVEQEERLVEDKEIKQKIGENIYPVDQSFIGALKFGMPPSGGNALGMDRLAMILTNTPDIGSIMYFPLKDL